MVDKVIGKFSKERETKNTVVFSRDNNGRKESQYVQKSVLEGSNPTSIEVVVRFE
jgi:hypothetical protein